MVQKKFFSRGRVLVAGAVIGLGSLTLAAAAMAQAPDGWRMFHHPRPGMENPAMRQFHMAQRLAALEVYLGITPEQEPQWRGFTTAMLAMVPTMEPPPGDAFAAIDQITAKVQAMAQPAQHLHDAADALKAVLTPDQLGRANAIWVAMREHMHGRWEHRGRGMGSDGAAPGGAAKPPGAPNP